MNKCYVGLILASGLCSSQLFAIDAGSIQRDIEKNLEKPQSYQEQKKQKVLVEDTDTKILVNKFIFSGNTIIPTQELENIVNPYVGKELSFKQLQTIVAQISDYYASVGGLAKIYLPKQDISDGTVKIDILEGKLNKVLIENTQAIMQQEQAENFIYEYNHKGAPIQNKDLSKALINLNNIGGLTARSSIAPGEVTGSSDLVIKLKDTARYQGDVGIDNYGSRLTGKEEFTAGMIINNLSESNLYDNLNLRAMLTEGVKYARVQYMVPMGYNGDKVGASFSDMSYKLLSRYNDFPGDGDAYTAALHYTHPFIRTQEQNLNFSTELAHKYSNNNGTSENTKKNNVANFILAYDKADTFMGGGSSNISFGLTMGHIAIDQDSEDIAKINGDYVKYKLNIMRIQTISETLSLQASYQYQNANKNLDSGEELSLGGVYGVRAYPTSEASGDKGWLGNIELKWAATPELTPSIFYDIGEVITNIDQWAGAANNTYSLGGYGAGLAWASSNNLNVKAQIAHRTTKSYIANATTGKNSDGTDPSEMRYWLSASWFF